MTQPLPTQTPVPEPLSHRRLAAGVEELIARNLITNVGAGKRSEAGGAAAELDSGYTITPAGCGVVDRLIAARRERLAEMFSEWPEEKHEEIAALISKLARELVPARQG